MATTRTTRTTVRLPLLCRELITNPIARPASYLQPSRLTFSTLVSILWQLPIGYLSARSIGQDSVLIPIYVTATRIKAEVAGEVPL